MAEERSGGRAPPGKTPAERTDPGMGGAKVPPRERTTLGVGLSEESATAAAPIVVVKPTRERTVLGVGASAPRPFPAPPAREISRQEPPPEEGWDVPEEAHANVAAPSDRSHAPPEALPSERSLVPAGVPRHRGRWLVIFLLLAAAAGFGYVRRDRLRPMLERALERAGLVKG